MPVLAVGQIEPMEIVDAFGNYQIGVTQALKGDGHPGDGRFMDLCQDWSGDADAVLRASYLRKLKRHAARHGANLIEFWGWPEVRFRADDAQGMIYSRVRFLRVVVVPQGRPN